MLARVLKLLLVALTLAAMPVQATAGSTGDLCHSDAPHSPTPGSGPPGPGDVDTNHADECCAGAATANGPRAAAARVRAPGAEIHPIAVVPSLDPRRFHRPPRSS